MSKFKLGRLMATKGVADKIRESKPFKFFVQQSLSLYTKGDWGVLSKSDRKLNDRAVEDGEGRIMGIYIYPPNKTKIWVITESDRSVTTVLFPSEY